MAAEGAAGVAAAPARRLLQRRQEAAAPAAAVAAASEARRAAEPLAQLAEVGASQPLAGLVVRSAQVQARATPLHTAGRSGQRRQCCVPTALGQTCRHGNSRHRQRGHWVAAAAMAG